MPKIKSPSKAKRDDEIRMQYEAMLKTKIQHKEAKRLLAQRYFLAYQTIENIIYRKMDN